LTILRKNFLSNKVIIVDGYVGGGKAMLSRILSCFDKVEMFHVRQEIEHVCALSHISSLSVNDAATLIRIWIDDDAYRQSLHRHTNFRFYDESSVIHHKKIIETLRRLFEKDHDINFNRFLQDSKVLNLQLHSTTPYADPIFEALDERLIYLRIVRSPMSTYMFNHVANWSDRWAEDSRSPMICRSIMHEGKQEHVPFFVKEFDEYVTGDKYQKAAITLEHWQMLGDKKIDIYKNKYNSKIIEITFEEFVLKPEPFLSEIADILGVQIGKSVIKEQKKQGIPRKSLTDAPHHDYFFDSGWRSPQENLTLKEEFTMYEKNLEKLLTPYYLKKMMCLHKDYIERHKIFTSGINI